ncbi:RCC1 domain-containing protein [Pseudobacteriovorax antillogorgiicola]|uniref:Alpha-tubulin suppressor n=1 Tax=Pseudobacteriovorax antillogorgiicola TaxID=1513793 RepID=A0A1Y6CIQ6_9BACT|nr:RCC1 domain-containing protein [Pseudobacteriovorax antillogorgiicola]TCS46371.1 alpha-tubulin suppressor-like RCC1 family protein [Pseudobacteriovorax antillogorgiicola]SMF68534.1 Alpha-tubulin suppressor [Pseudobacteriovorax antillogorgiicola]
MKKLKQLVTVSCGILLCSSITSSCSNGLEEQSLHPTTPFRSDQNFDNDLALNGQDGAITCRVETPRRMTYPQLNMFCALLREDGDVRANHDDEIWDWHLEVLNPELMVSSQPLISQAPWQVRFTISGADQQTLQTQAWQSEVTLNIEHIEVSELDRRFTSTADSMKAPGTIKSFALGANHSCALTYGEQLYCWGANQFGQLGLFGLDRASFPTLVASRRGIRELVAGTQNTCALFYDGSADCWGANHTGQLASDEPGIFWQARTLDLPFPVKMLALGQSHTCALDDNHRAFCWGYNADGALGVGDISDDIVEFPLEVEYEFEILIAGETHTCGIATDGTYCWGENKRGQLGLDHLSTIATPTLTAATTPLLHVDTHDVNCGLDRFGHAYCWGVNDGGLLGTEESLHSVPRPSQVHSPVTFRHLAAGRRHICGIAKNEGIYCWGQNTFRQLGHGNQGTLERRPQYVKGQDKAVPFTKIAAGNDFSCAMNKDHSLFCWGDNSFGQLGQGYDGAPEANLVQIHLPTHE